MRHSFQRIFNVGNGQVDRTIKAMFEKFHPTKNVYDDRAGNAGRPIRRNVRRRRRMLRSFSRSSNSVPNLMIVPLSLIINV
ncbi:hypothetical protein TNCT_568591 [Trichonephila clavata]|uniref:Uncharacterized protein n=1 Tax=Trichonephila clavata TaxID=2740835 RepID=A0A8X6HR22_TRICU|nr:hypothetical protein TNCT_568591 [Trichonephila clavata]